MAIDQRRLWREYAVVYRRLRVLEPYRQLLFQIVACAAITSDSHVLDLCCGDGGLLWALNAAGHRCSVVGLDNSDAMLSQASVERYEGPVHLIRADLNEPSGRWGALGQFDRIFCNNGLYALKNPTNVLAQAAEMAHAATILVASTPAKNPDPQAVLASHLRWLGEQGGNTELERHRLQEFLAPVARYNEQITAQPDAGTFHFPDEAELRGWFDLSGWKVTSLSQTYASQNWLVVAERR